MKPLILNELQTSYGTDLYYTSFSYNHITVFYKAQAYFIWIQTQTTCIHSESTSSKFSIGKFSITPIQCGVRNPTISIRREYFQQRTDERKERIWQKKPFNRIGQQQQEQAAIVLVPVGGQGRKSPPFSANYTRCPLVWAKWTNWPGRNSALSFTFGVSVLYGRAGNGRGIIPFWNISSVT